MDRIRYDKTSFLLEEGGTFIKKERKITPEDIQNHIEGRHKIYVHPDVQGYTASSILFEFKAKKISPKYLGELIVSDVHKYKGSVFVRENDVLVLFIFSKNVSIYKLKEKYSVLIDIIVTDIKKAYKNAFKEELYLSYSCIYDNYSEQELSGTKYELPFYNNYPSYMTNRGNPYPMYTYADFLHTNGDITDNKKKEVDLETEIEEGKALKIPIINFEAHIKTLYMLNNLPKDAPPACIDAMLDNYEGEDRKFRISLEFAKYIYNKYTKDYGVSTLEPESNRDFEIKHFLDKLNSKGRDKSATADFILKELPSEHIEVDDYSQGNFACGKNKMYCQGRNICKLLSYGVVNNVYNSFNITDMERVKEIDGEVHYNLVINNVHHVVVPDIDSMHSYAKTRKCCVKAHKELGVLPEKFIHPENAKIGYIQHIGLLERNCREVSVDIKSLLVRLEDLFVHWFLNNYTERAEATASSDFVAIAVREEACISSCAFLLDTFMQHIGFIDKSFRKRKTLKQEFIEIYDIKSLSIRIGGTVKNLKVSEPLSIAINKEYKKRMQQAAIGVSSQHE